MVISLALEAIQYFEQPDIIVEVAFTDTFSEPNPVWTDITDRVLGWDNGYGRSNEIGNVETGTGSLHLDNKGGAFTPDNPNSEFYPNVLPLRQVRIRAIQSDGTEEGLARGVIERWPVQLSGTSSEVIVPIADILKPLATTPPRSPIRFEVERLQPTQYWTLGQESVDALVSETDPTQRIVPRKTRLWEATGFDSAEITAGADGIMVGENSGTALKFTGSDRIDDPDVGSDLDMGWVAEYDAGYFDMSSDSFAFGFMAQVDDIPASPDDYGYLFSWRWEATDGKALKQHIMLYYAEAFDGYVFHVLQEVGGVAQEPVFIYMPGFSTGRHTIGEPHYFAVAWDADTGQFHLQFDDQPSPFIAPTEPLASVTDRRSRISLMGYTFRDGASGGLVNGSIQHLSWWNDRALSPEELETLSAGSRAYIGQPVHERIGYLLDQAGWPVDRRRISPSPTECERITWEDSSNVLQEGRDVSQDDGGVFYADPDGNAVFESRRDRAYSTVSVDFDHDKGLGVESGLVFETADEDIVNIAKVDNAYGVKVTIEDETSVRWYGPQAESLSLRIMDDNEAVQAGYHRVNRYKDPFVRVTGVTFFPSSHGYGHLWGPVLGLRFSDRIRLSGLPEAAPAEVMEFFVERVRHTVQRDGSRLLWVTSIDVSPTHVREGWILGDPVKGVLGSTTRLLY